jgi:hypothetical protein
MAGGASVTFRCDCGKDLTFSTFDDEEEQTRIFCAACGRVWLQKRTKRGWEKSLLSVGLKRKPT